MYKNILEKYKSQILHVRSHWNINDIIINKIKNGYSSNNFKICNKTNNEKILLKVYTNKTDIKTILNLLDNNFGAEILYYFEAGRIEKWYDHKTLSHSLIDSNILKQIAKLLSNFHDKTNLSHNDLNFNNILILNDNSLMLIDYKYVTKLDSREYDIANFFMEWMYLYKDEWYNYDLNLFPSLNQIKQFCKYYLGSDISNNHLDNFIKNVFSEIQNTNLYWYNWSLKYNLLDYQIYGLNRKKILNYNFEEMTTQNKVIYTDGTFDLCHIGHIAFFKKIRLLGCKKLIVGVLSDENVKSYKRLPILDLKNRSDFLKNIDLVDKVIENCPFNSITDKFIDDQGIDLIVYGGDPNVDDPLESWKNHYQAAIDRDIFKFLAYSKIQSTSNIINKIKLTIDI